MPFIRSQQNERDDASYFSTARTACRGGPATKTEKPRKIENQKYKGKCLAATEDKLITNIQGNS